MPESSLPEEKPTDFEEIVKELQDIDLTILVSKFREYVPYLKDISSGKVAGWLCCHHKFPT